MAEPEADCTTCFCPRFAVDDDDIVRRVLAGETALFEAIMRRYNQRLYRVARSILRDESEAQDVMQQAYVNAYLHLDQFAGRAKFSTWLTRIAVHEALARARRHERLKGLDSMSDESQADSPSPRDARPDPEQQLHTADCGCFSRRRSTACPRATARSSCCAKQRGLACQRWRSASRSARRRCGSASIAPESCCDGTSTRAPAPPAGAPSPSICLAAIVSSPASLPGWAFPEHRALREEVRLLTTSSRRPWPPLRSSRPRIARRARARSGFQPPSTAASAPRTPTGSTAGPRRSRGRSGSP